MSASELFTEAQNSLLQLGESLDVESASRLSRIFTELFVADLEFAVSRHVEILFWKVIRTMIDKVSSTKETAKCNENALNMSVSWLVQLSLRLHFTYRLGPNDFLPVMALSSAVADSDQKAVSEETKNTILSFLSLRIGDLMRYKNELETADRLYRVAQNLSPGRGDIWNQLGILAKLRGNMMDAVYFGVRALHATIPFPSASSNISTILRKYSEKEDVPVGAPFAELFLSVLARAHFIMPISDELISRLGPQLTEIRYLIPILATYSILGFADDETDVRDHIERLVDLSFSEISTRLLEAEVVDGSLLGCLSLLVRVPRQQETDEKLCSRIEEAVDIQVADTEYLQHFQCLDDPLQYPIVVSQLSSVLRCPPDNNRT